MSASTVFCLAYAGLFLLASWVLIRLSRTRPTVHQQTATDRRPGTDTADLAECELLWALPAFSQAHEHFQEQIQERLAADPNWASTALDRIAAASELDPEIAARLDRLRQAIRDQQNNQGDQ